MCLNIQEEHVGVVEEQHIVQQEQERAMELEHGLGHHHHLSLYPNLYLYLYHIGEEEAKQLIEASNDQEDDCIQEQVYVDHC
jgi:hypothetical protein